MSNRRAAFLVVASIALSVGAGSVGIADVQRQTSQPSASQASSGKDVALAEVTYPQVYSTPDGETHFREVKVRLTSQATAPPAQPVPQSEPQPATTIRHAVLPPGWGN